MPKARDTYRCEHCDLEVTGPIQYEQHINGQKHFRKLKVLGIQASEKPTPTSNAGFLVSVHAGRFVKSAGKTETEDVVEKGQFGLNITGPSHTAKRATLSQAFSPPPPPPPGLLISKSGNDNPVKKAVEANLLGKLPTKRSAPVYEGRCDLCSVTFSSKLQEDQHLAGKKHATKTMLSNGTHPLNSSTFYCVYCNVQSNSVSQMKQHETGQNHLKKAKLAQTMQAAVLSCTGASPAKKKFDPNESSVDQDQV